MPYMLIWSLPIPTNYHKGGVTNHMIQATAAFQESCLKKTQHQASHLCLWGNNSCRNQIPLLWNRFVSPKLLWNPHMLYLHFPNSPMFASLPSVSIIIHEFMGHLGTRLPALCLFLWLKKDDDAMSVSIQSTSILLTTLVFLRKMPAAQKTMRAFNTFQNHYCKKSQAYMEKGSYWFLMTVVVLLLLWSGFIISVPCKFLKYLTCRRSDMLISNFSVSKTYKGETKEQSLNLRKKTQPTNQKHPKTICIKWYKMHDLELCLLK